MLIGFCGRKRSGKTMLAKMVEKKYNGVTVTVANYLKYICCDMLGCSIEELNTKKDDGTVFSLYPDEKWYQIIHSKTGIDFNLIEKDLSGIEFTNIRQMLQVIGTDCIRKHKPTWHVDCMVDDIKKYLADGKTVAVDDVRFPNEREAIEELGGECFFIVRPYNREVSNHISETSLSWDMFDDSHIIINDTLLDYFKECFDVHLDKGFKSIGYYNILLSEKPGYKDLNLSFGKIKSEIVDEIISQNKDNEYFLEYGVITFTPKSPEMYSKLISEISHDNENNKCLLCNTSNINSVYYKVHYENNDETCILENIYIINPIINENLKAQI